MCYRHLVDDGAGFRCGASIGIFKLFWVFRSGKQETPHAIVFVYLRCNCHTGIWEYPIINKDSLVDCASKLLQLYTCALTSVPTVEQLRGQDMQ